MSEAENILFQTFRGSETDPGMETHLKIEGSDQSHYWLWTWDLHRTMMIGFTPEEFDALIKTLAVDRIQQAWELGREMLATNSVLPSPEALIRTIQSTPTWERS